MSSITTKYSAIVVLASKMEKTPEGEFIFGSDPHNFRLKAAHQLFKEGATAELILVGSHVDNEKDLPKTLDQRIRIREIVLF